jgi:RNA polymerase sigma-70 factor (ECF subfamily)
MTSIDRPVDPDHKEKQRRFMALLLPLRDRLARFARSMARSPEDAEDLVADTMLAAFEGFDRLKTPEAFLGYLFTIASRLHRQRSWRRKIFDEYDQERAAMIHHRGTSPETAADILFLRNALNHLPERQRETLVLFEISGLSLEEIREVQGGSLSGVKSRLTRGRERLAELLADPPVKTTKAQDDLSMNGQEGIDSPVNLSRSQSNG